MSTAPFSTFFLFIITINHRTCMYVQIQLAIMLMHSIMLLVFYFNPHPSGSLALLFSPKI